MVLDAIRTPRIPWRTDSWCPPFQKAQGWAALWSSMEPKRKGGPAPRTLPYGVTVKFDALVATPPEVVTAIGPVTAPAGTVASTSVSFTTVTLFDATPPNLTAIVPVKLLPEILTEVPTGPLLGLNPVIAG